ncbi:MAG TPA: divalent-cation tolerance protein CutA [Minicystis sp.]|nr:divalent-cation tolerance protein CutA [Minicystis sp.]
MVTGGREPEALAEPELRVLLCNTPPDRAAAIARALVERRLAACVNVLPGVLSVYRWQGAVEEAAESTLLVKTRASLAAAVTDAIVALHPYELPEVVSLPLAAGEGLAAYRAWLAAETSPPDGEGSAR